MYCLDSNILIEFLRENKQVIEKVHKHLSELSTTVITLSELYKGAFVSPKIESNLHKVRAINKSLKIHELDIYACRKYGEIYADLKNKGRPIEDFDIMIAAICISQNLTLITRNSKHFKRIKDLKVEEW